MSKQINILVVEDDRIAQMAIKYLLKELVTGVDTASTGKEALSLAEQNEYDLIFMDIGLPDIDGFRVTEIIRNKFNKKTPIIALTAHNDESRRDKCIQAGMNDFLEKPLTKEKTLTIIDKFLESFTDEN